MIKKLLKTTIARLINSAPRQFQEWLFRTSARELGVTSFTVQGKLGPFEGSINDSIVHNYYLKKGVWAPGLQKLLIEKVFRGKRGMYVDVGANIGLTVIPIAKEVGIPCIAVEPEQKNFNFLLNNIQNNGMQNLISPINKALMAEPGEISMEISETNMGDHRVRVDTNSNISDFTAYNETSRKTSRVEAIRFDDIVPAESPNRPFVVKIDVQGAEMQVLRGGRRTLSQVDYLIAEYWPYGLARLGDSPSEFLELLSQFPWGCCLDDENLDAPKLEPIEQILSKLKQVAENGNSTEHADIILSRHKTFDFADSQQMN